MSHQCLMLRKTFLHLLLWHYELIYLFITNEPDIMYTCLTQNFRSVIYIYLMTCMCAASACFSYLVMLNWVMLFDHSVLSFNSFLLNSSSVEFISFVLFIIKLFICLANAELLSSFINRNLVKRKIQLRLVY